MPAGCHCLPVPCNPSTCWTCGFARPASLTPLAACPTLLHLPHTFPCVPTCPPQPQPLVPFYWTATTHACPCGCVQCLPCATCLDLCALFTLPHLPPPYHALPHIPHLPPSPPSTTCPCPLALYIPWPCIFLPSVPAVPWIPSGTGLLTMPALGFLGPCDLVCLPHACPALGTLPAPLPSACRAFPFIVFPGCLLCLYWTHHPHPSLHTVHLWTQPVLPSCRFPLYTCLTHYFVIILPCPWDCLPHPTFVPFVYCIATPPGATLHYTFCLPLPFMPARHTFPLHEPFPHPYPFTCQPTCMCIPVCF